MDASAYREYQREYQRMYQREKRAWLQTLKEGKPCISCGTEYHPAAMQWHHRDPSKKTSEVSRLASYSKARILEEIAKCDLMCANCHAVETHTKQPEQA